MTDAEFITLPRLHFYSGRTGLDRRTHTLTWEWGKNLEAKEGERVYRHRIIIWWWTFLPLSITVCVD